MLEITSQQRNVVSSVRPQDLFEPLSYDADADYFYLGDASIGFGFSCTPLSGYDKNIEAKLESLIRQTYPADSMLQIILWSRSPAGLQDKQPADRQLQVFLIVKFPCRHSLPSASETEKVSELKICLNAGLQAIGLQPGSIGPNTYLDIMRGLMSGGRETQEGATYDDSRLIREQIVHDEKSVIIQTNPLRFGEKRVFVLSVTRYPDYICLENAGFSYLGGKQNKDPSSMGDYLLTLNVFFPSEERTISRDREGSHDRLAPMPVGRLDSYTPPLNAEHNVLYRRLNGDDRAILCNTTVCLFNEDEAQIDEYPEIASHTISYYRNIGFQIQEDRYIALPLLLNALPFGADASLVDELMRYKPMCGKDIASLFPAGYQQAIS